MVAQEGQEQSAIYDTFEGKHHQAGVLCGGRPYNWCLSLLAEDGCEMHKLIIAEQIAMQTKHDVLKRKMVE